MQAKDLRRIARENLNNNWALSIAVAALACILGGLIIGSSFLPEITTKVESTDAESLKDLLQIAIGSTGITIGFTSVLGLAQFIIGGVIELGYAKYLLNQYDHKELQFDQLFSEFHRFGQGFAQHFLRSLYTFLWSLLFIIPGIVKSYSYAMTPYLMIDNPDMTASEAINASKEMMDGHKADLFWLDLTFIGWDILANFTFGLGHTSLRLGIGHLLLNPYKNAARAAFYRDLCIQRYNARMEQG